MRGYLNIIALGVAIAVTACATPPVLTGYPVTTFSFQTLSDDALHDPVIVGVLDGAGFKETSSIGESGWSSRTLRINDLSPSVTLTLVEESSRPKCVRVLVTPHADNIAEAENLAVSLRAQMESKGLDELPVYPSSDCMFDS